jgi:hypothetical protein
MLLLHVQKRYILVAYKKAYKKIALVNSALSITQRVQKDAAIKKMLFAALFNRNKQSLYNSMLLPATQASFTAQLNLRNFNMSRKNGNIFNTA